MLAITAALTRSDPRRLLLLVLASALLFGWSVIGASSVGVFLVPAVLLSCAATVRTVLELGLAAATASVVVVVLSAYGIVALQLAVT